MKAAIYGRTHEANRSINVQQLFDTLHTSGFEIYIYQPLYDFIKDSITIKGNYKLFNRHEDIDGKVKFLFSLGGDGTLLETLELVKNASIPVMGINTGRLGFLSSVSKEDITVAIDAVMHNKYVIDKRTMLQLDTDEKFFGDVNYALNDITISKNESSSMLVIHAFLNGKFLNSYYADGLITCTPTGSTAYSLSCGGPIVMPNSGNFVVTPIAPHNLNVRPIIIPDSSVLTLKVEGRSPRYVITLDSRTMALETGTTLTIRKSASHMNIVMLENNDFLSTLRSKLMWGLDKRT